MRLLSIIGGVARITVRLAFVGLLFVWNFIINCISVLISAISS